MSEDFKKRYFVSIDLKSPVIIRDGKSGDGFAVTVREDGMPYIPASTIKGKLRDNFRKLVDQECTGEAKPTGAAGLCGCPVCSLFGGTGFQPARVFIDNMRYVPSDESDTGSYSIRSTVSIDRYRRLAKDKALAFSEVLEKGRFAGSIEVYFTGKTIKYEKQFKTALKMIEAIGSGKSRGLGFVSVEVKVVG